MQLYCIRKPDPNIWKTNIGVRKFDCNRLEMLAMIIDFILMHNKDVKYWFFEDNFLLINISINVIFKILLFV